MPGPQASGTHLRRLEVWALVLVSGESVEVVPLLGKHLRACSWCLTGVVNGYDAGSSGVRYACEIKKQCGR